MENVIQDEYKKTNIWKKFGVLIEPTDTNHIKHHNSSKDLYKLISEYGVVIFRGFEGNEKDFAQWVANHSEHVTLDPARKSDTPNIAAIQVGDVEMGLHRENASLPYVPDLQWFYCKKEATHGSETTFCDGEAVLEAFTKSTRESFLNKRIRYDRKLPWNRVRRYLAIEHKCSEEEINDDIFKHVQAKQPLHHFIRIDNKTIHSVRDTFAVLPGLSGRISFCNSILGPSVNYEPPRICWSDDSDISAEILTEVENVTRTLTEDLFWHKNDFVVVDNNRIMHGRRKLSDPSRLIFGAQSYLKKGI